MSLGSNLTSQQMDAPNGDALVTMMNETLKKLLNTPLELLGLRLIRVKRRRRICNGRTRILEIVRIGLFDLKLPRDGWQARAYLDMPLYSSELGRLAALVELKYPVSTIIDVGANIGDTAAIIRSSSSLPLVCIEGDRQCAQFLYINAKAVGAVEIIDAFLDEISGSRAMQVTMRGRNATLLPNEDKHAERIEFRTLDELCAEHSSVGRAKLLKVDAEGFDCRILRGGKKLLVAQRPVLYFEYSRENMDKLGEDGLVGLAFLQALGYARACIYDAYGRFILDTTLDHTPLLAHLHEYADGYRSKVIYYDVIVFHADDEDIAARFVVKEREFRRINSGPSLLDGD